MAKKSNSKLKANITSPLLYIALGLLFIIFKAETLNWVITLAGAFFILSSIVDFIRGMNFSAAVNLFIGVVILVLGNTILDIVLIVLGLLIALKGLLELLVVMKMKKKKRNVLLVIFPVLTMVLGIALAFGNLLGNLIMILGVLLVIDGVLGLLGAKK
jgi:hypothetical protein